MDLALLKSYVISLIGTPYFYGGDDPISGFDCSGLASEILRASGLCAWNWRGNAQAIHDLLSSKSMLMKGTTPQVQQLGAFAFYGVNAANIDHVTFCLDGTTMVEAGGGDHTTVTKDIASRQNAFVRLRPIRFRKDFLCAIMPLY